MVCSPLILKAVYGVCSGFGYVTFIASLDSPAFNVSLPFAPHFTLEHFCAISSFPLDGVYGPRQRHCPLFPRTRRTRFSHATSDLATYMRPCVPMYACNAPAARANTHIILFTVTWPQSSCAHSSLSSRFPARCHFLQCLAIKCRSQLVVYTSMCCNVRGFSHTGRIQLQAQSRTQWCHSVPGQDHHRSPLKILPGWRLLLVRWMVPSRLEVEIIAAETAMLAQWEEALARAAVLCYVVAGAVTTRAWTGGEYMEKAAAFPEELEAVEKAAAVTGAIAHCQRSLNCSR
jgi:hypothetical protein